MNVDITKLANLLQPQGADSDSDEDTKKVEFHAF